MYHGGLQPPNMSQYSILVSSPAALSEALENGIFSLSHFTFIVFDEVHHLLKNHPYCSLSERIRNSQPEPQVLGLSTCPKYVTDDELMKIIITHLINSLHLRKILTSSLEELHISGYKVASITYSVDSDTIKALTKEAIFFYELWLKWKDSAFETPNADTTTSNEWIHNLRELRCKYRDNIDVMAVSSYLEHLHEAHRLQKRSSSAGDLSMHYLEMVGCFCGFSVDELEISWHPQNNPYVDIESLPRELRGLLSRLFDQWKKIKDAHNQVNKLKAILVDEDLRCTLADFEGSFRCIIFVEDVVTCHILQYFLTGDDEMNYIGNVTFAYPPELADSTSTLGSMTTTEYASRLEKFSTGEVHIMIAVWTADKRLNVKQADSIICFDSGQAAAALAVSRDDDEEFHPQVVLIDEVDAKALERLKLAEYHHSTFLKSVNTLISRLFIQSIASENPRKSDDLPTSQPMNVDESEAIDDEEDFIEFNQEAQPLPSGTQKWKVNNFDRFLEFCVKIFSMKHLNAIAMVKLLAHEDGGSLSEKYRSDGETIWRCFVVFQSRCVGRLTSSSATLHRRKKQALEGE